MSEPQLLSAYAGHWTGDGTGVTVIVPPPGTVASGEVRGGAPATREFELLSPVRTVSTVSAVVLSGGSAFGLAAGDGVMRALRSRGVGFETPLGPVPIVIGMSIFDASVAAADASGSDAAEPAGVVGATGSAGAGGVGGEADGGRVGGDADGGRVGGEADGGSVAGLGGFAVGAPPGASAGERALAAALSGEELAVGAVGAGAGATTGKWRERLDPGGLGVAQGSAGGATVVAIVVVNAWGDVIGPDGRPVFDADAPPSGLPAFGHGAPPASGEGVPPGFGLNTTIGIVLTDAQLTKNDCFLLAQSGHTGYARAIHPAHSRYDGDAVVALATGEVAGANLDLLRAAAAETMAAAIRNAVSRA